jgi:hypothetical protein
MDSTCFLFIRCPVLYAQEFYVMYYITYVTISLPSIGIGPQNYRANGYWIVKKYRRLPQRFLKFAYSKEEGKVFP